jgi:hypothetical protein
MTGTLERLQISGFRCQIGAHSEINLHAEFCNLKSQDLL